MPDALATLEDWLAGRGWTPFAFQRQAWQAYLDGESGLIHAPTGTGKTYAAWLGVIGEAVASQPAAILQPEAAGGRKKAGKPKQPVAAPLTALWITPLRALAVDTEAALRAPVTDLGLAWTVESRTGDTSSAARARQARRLPSALVTTPESLSLLLTRPDAAGIFAGLRLVVVDEWHELLASKRGTQTELALARLRRWSPALRTWGVSATLGNLDEALRALLGVADFTTGEIPAGRTISAALPKTIVIDSVIPPTMERFPWAGHLGLRLLPQVIQIIAAHASTLVFTNTRAQTELWYQAILDARPDWAGEIAVHHSALDRDVRDWVEAALKAGRLRCVVCTSSLDLGVDFAPVERVIQIGSPRGVARLLQRAGRSGHQPGAVSRATVVPTNAFELIETAAARHAAQHGLIEARPPLDRPLDVLLQHLVTVALGGGFDPDNLYREVRTTHAFRRLTPAEWTWTLDFQRGGGVALAAYPQYHRIAPDETGRYTVQRSDIARLHRMSIGTISSDASLTVQFLKGGKLGTVDEAFISRLRPGDKFTLAGRVVQFVRVRDMTAWVRLAKNSKGVIPRWYGGRMPVSESLAAAVVHLLDEARDGRYDSPEMQAVRPILDLQAQWSAIPTTGPLLIERVKTREGHHLFFYPFAGRLAHEGLAALMAYRLARYGPITFTLAAGDHGFELLSAVPAPLETALADGLFADDALLTDILAALNAAEMARRQFREIARVTGLVLPRFPGGQATTKQLQVSSGLIYDVLTKYDPDNELLVQAQREVLAGQLEIDRVRAALARVRAGGVDVRDVQRVTPFAFPLYADLLRQTVTSETLDDRIRRLATALESAAR